MKRQLLSFLLSAIVTTGFCTIHTISNSGTTFSPSTITINVGDSIRFTLANNHNAVEVSEATWNSNGSTALPGFSVPFGGGVVPAADLPVGTHYYVCVPHAAIGMKGKIIVQSVTGVNETLLNPDISIFPNPTKGVILINMINSEPQKNYNLNIFDISGANILTTNISNQLSNNVDLSEFPKGVYFIQINNESELYTRKIIIE
jgi:plastocyanin